MGILVWNRVVAIPAKRVAAPDPPRCKPGTLYRSVLFQSLKRIGRAGGLIPAVKTDPWAEDQPIGVHGQRYETGKG